MDGKRFRTSSAVTAAALMLLTLAVFSVLQDYGPESAIRRFRDAVRRMDGRALAAVTEEPLDDPRVTHLVQAVKALDESGASYQILRMDREPRRVAAEVLYTLPDGRQGQTWWIVVKSRRAWRVEARETGRAFRQTLGL